MLLQLKSGTDVTAVEALELMLVQSKVKNRCYCS